MKLKNSEKCLNTIVFFLLFLGFCWPSIEKAYSQAGCKAWESSFKYLFVRYTSYGRAQRLHRRIKTRLIFFLSLNNMFLMQSLPQITKQLANEHERTGLCQLAINKEIITIVKSSWMVSKGSIATESFNRGYIM